MGRASPPHANLDAARAEVDELRELGFDVALLDERLRTAAEAISRGHHQRAAALTHEVMVLARAMRRIDFTSVTRGDDPTLTEAEGEPVHDLLGRVRADLFHLDVAEEEAPGPLKGFFDRIDTNSDGYIDIGEAETAQRLRERMENAADRGSQ